MQLAIVNWYFSCVENLRTCSPRRRAPTARDLPEGGNGAFFWVSSGRGCGAELQLAIERPEPWMVLNLWPLGNIWNIWHLDPSKPAGVTSKGAWYFERAHPHPPSLSISIVV